MKFLLSVIMMIVAICAAFLGLFALGFIIYGNWVYWDGEMGHEATGFMWLFCFAFLAGGGFALLFYRLSRRLHSTS